MIKAILIIDIDENRSSTKKILNKIHIKFQNIKHIVYDINDMDPFWGECDKDTNLIIITNVLKATQLEPMFNAIQNGVTVHKQSQDPFHIDPIILFVANFDRENIDIVKNSASYNRRFDILYTSTELHSLF